MNKGRLIITSVLSIFLSAVLLIGSTYSIFTSQEIDETANVYKTGNLEIKYATSGSIQTDPIPKNEVEADGITPYRITVTNTGNVPYQFDVILTDTTSGEENTINYQYIMTKVGYLDTKPLSECTNNIIKEDVILLAGEAVDIDIRVWISDTVTNSELGKSFYAKLTIDGQAVYNDSKEINNDMLSLRYMTKLVNNYYETNKYFKVDEYRDYIKTASFVNYVDISNSSVDENGNKIMWDLTASEYSNSRIIAWLEEKEVDENGVVYYDLYIGSTDKIYTTNLHGFFANMKKLEYVYFDNLDISLCQDLLFMFRGCSSLTSLDVSNFDTSNVTNMGSMFNGCSSLTSLDVSNFDTSNVTNMGSMFNGCSSLTSLDVSNFDTSKITDMEAMFANCSSLTSLDASNFDTSNVTIMRSMFKNCKNIESLDVSGFDTSKVTNTSMMFEACNILNALDVSNWDTSSLTTAYSMFKSCNNITSLDVSRWNTSNLTSMYNMFQYMYKLTNLDLSNWDLSQVTAIECAFNYCNNLTTTLTITNTNTATYSGIFGNAATIEGASITVYYVEDNPNTAVVNESTESLVDSMIATKSTNSNVVKGELIV